MTESRKSDPLLMMYVKIIELRNTSMPFTFTLPGSVISGEVVSFATYAKEMQALFGSSLDVSPYAADARVEDIPDPEYVHMRNAELFFGTNTKWKTGLLYRARLSDVSGYAFGSVSSS